jgi:hypothetical protein
MKKYNTISIISFFIIIIAFLTPAAISSETGEIFWIWGFRMKKSIKIVNNIPAFNLSIICSSVILICTILSIVFAIKYRKSKKDIGSAWIIFGIIIILTTIIWSFVINILLRTEVETQSEWGSTTTKYIYFWETHYVGFGIIGLIIGGILMVTAGIMNLYHSNESKIVEPIIKPDVIQRTSFFVKPTVKREDIQGTSFSVKPPVVDVTINGEEVVDESQTDEKKYCLFCGAEVKLGSKSCKECGNKIE